MLQENFPYLNNWLAEYVWLGITLKILLILILMFIALVSSNILSRKLFAFMWKDKDEEFRKRASTLSQVTNVVLRIVIFAVAVMMILGAVGIEIGPIIAAAGVAGVAIGFGAQHIVQDVISGFFILLDDQIRVGDVVEAAGKSGLVERIDLRITVLRDLSGNVHFIRNGTITAVTNMTREYSRYVFDIGVAYHEDVDRVCGVIREVDAELREDMTFGEFILEPIEILGLDKFGDSAVVIRARTKTKPIKQWDVAREFNRRLKKKFDELGIEIPFPQRTVHMTAPQKKSPAPENIKFDEDGEI
jgi:small conductance mechanosensitive channel